LERITHRYLSYNAFAFPFFDAPALNGNVSNKPESAATISGKTPTPEKPAPKAMATAAAATPAPAKREYPTLGYE